MRKFLLLGALAAAVAFVAGSETAEAGHRGYPAYGYGGAACRPAVPYGNPGRGYGYAPPVYSGCRYGGGGYGYAPLPIGRQPRVYGYGGGYGYGYGYGQGRGLYVNTGDFSLGIRGH